MRGERTRPQTIEELQALVRRLRSFAVMRHYYLLPGGWEETAVRRRAGFIPVEAYDLEHGAADGEIGRDLYNRYILRGARTITRPDGVLM